MMTNHRTAVYRCYNAAGELLYVGRSRTPRDRWYQHRSSGKPWVAETVRREEQWFDSETEAADAEEVAIYTEHPTANRRRSLPRGWEDFSGRCHQFG